MSVKAAGIKAAGIEAAGIKAAAGVSFRFCFGIRYHILQVHCKAQQNTHQALNLACVFVFRVFANQTHMRLCT